MSLVRIRTMLALVGIASLLLLLLPVCNAPAEGPPPVPGASLAEMVLPDLYGKRYALSDVKEKRVVVVFWAYWCDTWKAALPHLLALHTEREELGCAIRTVSIDGTYTAEVRSQAAKIPFPLLLDDGSWRDRLGLRRVPTVLLLDANRTVVNVYEGYPGNVVLESALRKMK